MARGFCTTGLALLLVGIGVPVRGDHVRIDPQSPFGLGGLNGGRLPLNELGQGRLGQLGKRLTEEVLKDPDRYGVGDLVRRSRLFPSGRPMRGPIDPDDPRIPPVIEGLRKAARQDPEVRKRLEETVRRIDAESNGPGTKASPPAAGEPAKPPDGRGKPVAGRPPATGGPAPAAEGEQKSRSQTARWMLEQAEKLQKAGGPLADSPALQRAVRDWAESLDRPGTGGTSWADRVAGWVRSARQSPLISGKNLPSLPRIFPPDLPRPHFPDVRLPGVPSLPGFGPPPVGSPGVPGGGAGTGLVWVVVLALFGLVLWRILRRAPAADDRAGAGGWRLGGWPVAPGAVSTPEELIQAFEYLSLLRLGPRARSWNHRHIAAALEGMQGDPDLRRRQAARHLAALYERARYVPRREPLTEADLVSARGELALLAGVPAS